VAFACACLLVPWRRYERFLVPLLAGAGLGVAAIASSPNSGRVPWLAAVLVVAVLIAAGARRPLPGLRISPRVAGVAAVVVLGVLAALALLLHHEIGLRALAPSDGDRSVEWSAAWHQWASAPYFGVGPDRLLVFHASDGTYAHFAHNEYLQIAADAGAVGLALLAACAVAMVRVVRRFDVLSSCATAALACWAVGGVFDFDWHLVFIGALGGWCAGLATRGRLVDKGGVGCETS
jgi:O-antigen ligase